MNKLTKILAAAMGVALSISMVGCSQFATVNPEKKSQKDQKEAKETAMIINSEKITRGEYVNMYMSVANYFSQMGMDLTQPEQAENLKTFVYDELVKNTVILQKAKEKGLDKLSKEEQAEIDKTYEEQMKQYAAQYVEQVKQENPTLTPEKDQAEIDKKANAILDEKIIESGSSREEIKKGITETKVYEKLQKSIEDTAVTEEKDVKAYYDKQVEDQKKQIEADPTAFEQISASGTAVFAPEGYFYVKHILIPKDADETADAEVTAKTQELETLRTELGTLVSGDKAANAQAITDAEAKIKIVETAIEQAKTKTFAAPKTKADEVMLKVKANEDFDALIKEFGQDPGMQQEPTMSTGYSIGPKTAGYVKEFSDASLALKKIGDVSEPVKTEFGYHIIKRVGDQAAGVVAYDQVKDKMKEAAEAEAKFKKWDDQVKAWTKEVKVEKFEDKMKVDLSNPS